MKKNPNATVAFCSGVVAALLLWSAHKVGWTLPSYYASALASLVTALVLWVGRDGLRGVTQRIWHGRSAPGGGV